MVDAAGDRVPLLGSSVRARSRPAVERCKVEVSQLSGSWLASYADFAAHRPRGAAQEPVWARAWHRHASPDIVAITAEDDGAPALMLALEVVRQGPFRVARFIGGSHANANFPAADGRWARGAGGRELRAIARDMRRARPDIDLLRLERMAESQGGTPNPLLAAGRLPSPNPALSLALEGSMAETLKRLGDRRKARKHRSKQRKFEETGGVRRVEARSDAAIDRLLSAFFAFKEARFREAGIPDVFAEPAVRAAFLDVFRESLGEASPPFLLHGLEVGGMLRAVTGSSRTADRTTCEFGAIGSDEMVKHSPGEFLFYENIEEACAAGQRFYDFGVGDEPYKRSWCDTQTTHFDVLLPLTGKGRVLAGSLSLLGRLKTAVKRNPAVWQAVKGLRRRAVGAAPDKPDDMPD